MGKQHSTLCEIFELCMSLMAVSVIIKCSCQCEVRLLECVSEYVPHGLKTIGVIAHKWHLLVKRERWAMLPGIPLNLYLLETIHLPIVTCMSWNDNSN